MLHHAFGGYPSLRDITKTALPVIPFTFSMETTIEAALDLVAKPCVVQRVYDIRALQWFVYLGKPFGIDIKAQLLNDNTVLCRIYNIVDGQKNLSFESKVEINTQPITPLVSSGFIPKGDVPSAYSKANYYNGAKPHKPWVPGEFHGPTFQADRKSVV